MKDKIKPIQWVDRTLILIDQRMLPHELAHAVCTTPQEVADAIRSMLVRGAPAIGVCAAYGVAMAATQDATRGAIRKAAELLRATRPTAKNLMWALDRMLAKLDAIPASASPAKLRRDLEKEATAIFDEDLAACHRIGLNGAALLGESTTVLTHCNAGALATAGYGTALGILRAAHEAGKKLLVYADETRPYLQGARLTAWELMQEGIDVRLITDNMSGHFFQSGTFGAVIVGADRIAANGDTANKIGTYTLAVLAAAHDVPFYVAAPVSTIDIECASGAGIPIEERSADEVTETHGWDEAGKLHRVRLAPKGVEVRHPAFDVTPARLITAIITERGIARAPYEESIRALVAMR